MINLLNIRWFMRAIFASEISSFKQLLCTGHVFMLKIRNGIVVLMLMGGLFVGIEGYAAEPTTNAAAEPATNAAAEPATNAAEPAAIDTKALLEQRATQYWKARQARDIRTQYDMESAALPGGWLTPDKAMTVGGLLVRKVTIKDISIDGDHAKVRVSADVMVGTLGWTPQTLEQAWVLINGQWYHETRR